MRRLGICTLALLALPRAASACPVCFGASDGPMLRGSNMGIFVLLMVTLVVLGAFAMFFAVLARRAKAAHLSADETTPVGWRPSQAGSQLR